MPPKERPLARDEDTSQKFNAAVTTTTPALQPGTSMPDGAIYVGISPTTKKPSYAMPVTYVLRTEFQDARDLARKTGLQTGAQDVRLPTRDEWDLMMAQQDALAKIMPKPQHGKGDGAISGFTTNFCHYWTDDFNARVADANGMTKIAAGAWVQDTCAEKQQFKYDPGTAKHVMLIRH